MSIGKQDPRVRALAFVLFCEDLKQKKVLEVVNPREHWDALCRDPSSGGWFLNRWCSFAQAALDHMSGERVEEHRHRQPRRWYDGPASIYR